MNEQIQNALAPLKQFWTKTPGTVKKIAIGGIIISIIAALAVSMLLNSENYVVLYDQLSASESSEIMAQLQELEVSVKLDANKSIMVPEKDESRIRMALATAGYPKSGLSYYLIQENSGMLTTDYERKQYMNMQLQERIAASIKTLDGVKDAVVTITAPTERVFYLQEKEEPSASVIIHMSPGNTLTESQISGIQNLVAKAVSGLSKDNIALSDSQGNDLGKNAVNDSPDYSKLSVTREIENDIKKKVNSVLIGPYDTSQFKISVTATVDTDELVTEQTLYTPSEQGQNSGVISEETKTEESSSNMQSSGGVAGTSSNSEVPTYPAGGSGGESTSTSSNESKKYQVSETKSQSQKSGPKVESISIGIAVDKLSFEPGERESITQLVAFATGVSPESISIQNFKFSGEDKGAADEEAAKPGMNKMILYGGIGAAVLLLLAAILLFVLKGSSKKNGNKAGTEKRTSKKASSDEDEMLNEIFGEIEPEKIKHIKPVQDLKRDEIKQFAKENPEIVAQMIKTLLRSED